jgi:hypothetical protein
MSVCIAIGTPLGTVESGTEVLCRDLASWGAQWGDNREVQWQSFPWDGRRSAHGIGGGVCWALSLRDGRGGVLGIGGIGHRTRGMGRGAFGRQTCGMGGGCWVQLPQDVVETTAIVVLEASIEDESFSDDEDPDRDQIEGTDLSKKFSASDLSCYRPVQ